MNTVMNKLFSILFALPLVAQSAYAVDFDISGENYNVISLQGRKVAVPMFLDLELKAKGAPMDCTGFRDKLSKIKEGLSACTRDTRDPDCKFSVNSLNFFRNSGKLAGKYRWYPKVREYSAEENEPLAKLMASTFNIAPRDVMLDVRLQFKSTPSLVFGENSLSQQIASLGAPVHSSVSMVSYSHDGFMDDQMMETDGLDVACDLVEGNAKFKFEEAAEVTAVFSNSLHFSPNQALSVFRILSTQKEIGDETETPSALERAAMAGARLAKAAASVEFRIEPTDENIRDLFRMFFTPNLRLNRYSNQTDLTHQWFFPSLQLQGTWYARMPK